MKITQKQLRQIIRETLEEQELDEITMEQGKVQAPLQALHGSLSSAKQALGKAGAKKAISELLQNAGPGSDVMDKAQKLLRAITQIESNIDAVMKWLGNPQSTALTKDPWAHVGKHG
jgi:seryl-tRNA synthetase